MSRTARSMATHAITLECVKCRRGPRTSQIPSSGWVQPVSLEEMLLERPGVLVAFDADPARLVKRVHHLAVHVELELMDSGVADAHGRRGLVAGQPVEHELGEPALAAGTVHDQKL